MEGRVGRLEAIYPNADTFGPDVSVLAACLDQYVVRW